MKSSLDVFTSSGSMATVKSKNGGALRDKYKYIAEIRCIGKEKSIVTIARKLGELLYLILKTDQEYKPQRFITPDLKISKLANKALECS